MKIKIYKLLSHTKQALLAVALTGFLGTAYSQTTHTFNYTGSTQTISLPPGNYSIQCWGADGGDATSGTSAALPGGKGGYATGSFSNSALSVFNIYVGGHGGNASGSNVGGGGGGMSDVAPASNTAAIIIAAGGGAGGASGTSSSERSTGGDGGGLVGGTANDGTGVSTGTAATGGSQTAGGFAVAGSYGAGSPGGYGYGGGGANGGLAGTIHGAGGAGGYGGNGGWNGGGGGSNTTSGNDHAGGGGAGYYGGGGGRGDGGAGGGGSSYIGGVTNGVTIMFGQGGYVSNPDLAGNGRVHITELCNITLVATGTDPHGAICSGNSVTLTTNAISNYSWSTGATTSSIVVNPTSNTVYSLTATAPTNCTTSAFITVLVNQGVPTLSVANTASSLGGICPGQTVQLTASGASTYTWTGGTSVTNGVPFSPSSTSGYTVTGENACGTSTAATSVSVDPIPAVTLSASQNSVCTTQSVSLCPGGAQSYTILPLGTPSCAAHYPSGTETYTAIGMSALGCTNSAMATVSVEITPSLPPTASPMELCIGESTTLTATGASNYSWMPGNSTASSFVDAPTVNTTYTLTQWNANCVDVQVITVTVNPLPTVFAFATPTVVCATSPASLAAGGGNSFTWSPGPLPSGSLAANVVVFPQSNTVYTLTAFDGKCVNSTTVAVNTHSLPVISMAPSSTNICVGETVNFNVTGADSYSFSNNPPTSPALTGPSAGVTLTATTNYMVTGTNSVTGCSGSTQELILVNELPVISVAAAPAMVCAGFPSMLSASSTQQRPAHTYSWTHTGTGTSSVVNPQTTSVYTVSGTNTITTCMNTQTVLVSVFNPSFTTTSDTAICFKGSVTLKASGASQYVWEPGNITGVNAIVVSPSVNTIYTVSANSTTVGGLTCNSSQTIKVDIYSNPTITATSERTIVCRNEAVELYASGANTYTWINGGNQQDDTISVSPLQKTTYIVIGTDAAGCKDTATILIEFSNCPGFAEHTGRLKVSVFPNPNTGVFTIQGAENISLNLINELGQVVRVIQLDTQNNHTVNLQGLAPGIYFLNGRQQNAVVTEKIIIE